MLRRFIAAVAIAMAAGAAHAEPPKWYGFLGFGWTSARAAHPNNDDDLRAQGFTGVRSENLTAETSMAFGGGYNFTRRFALEAAYADFNQVVHNSGSFQQVVTTPTGPQTNHGSTFRDWQASGLRLSAVGAWPVAPWLSLLGQASLYRLKGEFKTQTELRDPRGNLLSKTEAGASDSGLIPAIGVGVLYPMEDFMSARLMVERLGKVDLYGPGNEVRNLTNATISILIHF